MKDFTKDELIELYHGLDNIWCTLVEHQKVLRKLENSIDDYDSLERIKERTLLHGGVNK